VGGSIEYTTSQATQQSPGVKGRSSAAGVDGAGEPAAVGVVTINKTSRSNTVGPDSNRSYSTDKPFSNNLPSTSSY
jgi:hypothetical protein